MIEDGFCNVFDVKRSLLAQAPRIKNRLYLLKMQFAMVISISIWWQRRMRRPEYGMLAMVISISSHFESLA